MHPCPKSSGFIEQFTHLILCIESCCQSRERTKIFISVLFPLFTETQKITETAEQQSEKKGAVLSVVLILFVVVLTILTV